MRARLVLVLLLSLSCRSRKFEEVSLSLDAGLAATVHKGDAEVSSPELRIAVAAIQSPKGTFASYSRLLDMLGDDLAMRVTLVQRRTYRETNDLLTSGRIDVALVCTGGYFDLEQRSGAAVDLIAVPVVRGVTTYESVIIVPSASAARTLEDLAGKRFAFTDDLSLSGYAYPMHAVRKRGLDPLRFFTSAYYTHSHDRSVEAVARGFVDGASVDGNVLADMLVATPSLQHAIRVLERSPPFGIPPVVALTSLDAQTRQRIRAAFLALDARRETAAVLKEMGVERFVAPDPEQYRSAFAIMKEATE